MHTASIGHFKKKVVAILLTFTTVLLSLVATAPASNAAVLGGGFTVTVSDLQFILDQIRLAESHAARNTTATPGTVIANTNPLNTGAAVTELQAPTNLSGSVLARTRVINRNTASLILASSLLPGGLRQTDGRNNNLSNGFSTWTGWGYLTNTDPLNRSALGASDTPFPRMVPVSYRSGTQIASDSNTKTFDYGLPRTGSVIDRAPRYISNLISDQSECNIAAYLASQSKEIGVSVARYLAEGKSRDQANAAAQSDARAAYAANAAIATACNDTNRDAIMQANSLSIPAVAPDSFKAPFNGNFVLFGQFFDHGLDLVGKSGTDHIQVPVLPGDPLYTTCTQYLNYGCTYEMSAGRTVLGADQTQAGTNSTTPWVDQNQTYTSHPSHQVFLREYRCVSESPTNISPTKVCSSTDRPVATGKLLDSYATVIGGAPSGNTATWADIKLQALNKLGITLADFDVYNVPLLLTDEFGQFLRGAHGFPMLVNNSNTTATLTPAITEGDWSGTGATAALAKNAKSTNHAFLNDIAYFAQPHSASDTCQAGNAAYGGAILDLSGNPVANAYDCYLLNKHFSTGDGRGNENIGLTSIHTVFHSEHNRLIDYIKSVIDGATQDPTIGLSTPGSVIDFKNAWKVDSTTAGFTGAFTSLDWNGERLFQAARLITEMEYQHLVFGEFVRKVSPLIGAFVGYNETLDPSITAEFAHAVYRYGHSQLVDNVARTDASGAPHDIDLLSAFLNPPAFNSPAVDGSGLYTPVSDMTLTAKQGAGNVIRGMTNQTGNEIDEFITGDLRNSLLGQPLDLATLNLVRGRDAGIAPLNVARSYFYGQTANLPNKSISAALAPYANWLEFAQNLRHPESLVNFIAAYGIFSGTLPVAGATSLNPNDFTPTFGQKRAIAQEIINCFLADQTASNACVTFMTGAAASTGVDGIDLWVGGLAEKSTRLGTMLGSTFDYVFKTQLENLQESDRFYYLGRLAGTNLVTQVETNFFSDIAMRNTDIATLPADAFVVPTRTVNLPGSLAIPATNGQINSLISAFNGANIPGLIFDASTRAWSYNGTDHLVWNGTNGNDVMRSGDGDDTLHGDDGNDWLVGGSGDDFIMGGNGNDVIEDQKSSVLDTLIGGAGNDYIGGGAGLASYNGNEGDDFIIGGDFPVVALGSIGNDWIRGSVGNDALSGDAGDDWLEGVNGSGDVITGDNIGPLGVVSAGTVPGNDVMIASPGGGTFNGLEGSDILKGHSGGDVYLGGNGFDWMTSMFSGETSGTNEDLDNLAGPVCPNGNPCLLADQFTDVEGLSGSQFADVLFGSSVTALNTPAAPPALAISNGLTANDCVTINGLTALMNSAGVTNCTWTLGDVILGGAGDDVITGRNGRDIIDGNAYLSTWIKIPSNWGIAVNPSAPVSTDPAFQYVNDMGTVKTYVHDHNLGVTNPISQMSIFRTIQVAPAVVGENDIAVFQAPRANYTIVVNANGSITVTDPRNGGGAGVDGIDTLVNIETLQFSDVSISVASLPLGAPTLQSATALTGGLSVTFRTPAIPAGFTNTGYRVRVWNTAARNTAVVANVDVPESPVLTNQVAGLVRTATVSGLAAGTYYVDVIALSSNGATLNIAGVQPAAALGPIVVASTSATKLLLTRAGNGAVTTNALTIQPIISVASSTNVVAPGSTNLVTATISAGATISGATATAVAGVATFSALAITGPNGTYTITYSSPGLTSVTQTVTVVTTVGTGTLTITQAAASATGSGVFSTQPILSLSGTTTATSVTASISGGAVLGGNAPVAITSGGSANYAGLSVTTVPITGTYLLTFTTDGGETTSQPVTLIATGGVAGGTTLTTAPGASAGQIVVTWSAVPSATSYSAQAFTQATGGTAIRACTVSVGVAQALYTCTITGLATVAQTYWITVVPTGPGVSPTTFGRVSGRTP